MPSLAMSARPHVLDAPIATPQANLGDQITPSFPMALPPGHFLSLPPSFAGPSNSAPSSSQTTSAHESNGLAPNIASLASADFEVDVRTGFLPADRNVERLGGSWVVWEEALDAARGAGPGDGVLLGGNRERELLWRKGVQSMPVLAIDGLSASLCLLRRAHVVLAFLTHFYAHTTIAPNPVEIPACLGVPLLAVSDLLGLPPVLTYADTVLYNFHASALSSALSLATNPPTYTLASFTNTRSEQQFYIISALCEIAGSEALRLMRRSLDELFLADQTALRRLTLYLKKLAVQIDRIGDITLSIMKEVDPEEFYHLIRPWFKGGDSEGPDSLGWLFMGADDQAHAAENANRGERKGRMFSGPSAGQSSLIHAIDIFLTVDHSPTDDEVRSVTQQPSPALHLNHSPVVIGSTEQVSESSSAPTRPAGNNEASFVQRMLQYMPLPHRTFLLHLSTHPTPLRPLVIAHAQSHPHLAAAYDSALEALKRFREKHMRVVSLFIVQQARRKPSPRIRRLLGDEVNDEEDEEETAVAKEAETGELRGTGGTPLFKFLKRCRDNTTKAMIGTSAGPTYELE